MAALLLAVCWRHSVVAQRWLALIFLTLAALAGLPAPETEQPIDGIDLSRVLASPGKTIRDYAYHAYPRGGKMGRAIRTERYRLIEWLAPEESADQAIYELYDYQDDPQETENIADVRPQVMAQLKAMLAREPAAALPVRRN